MSAIKELFKPSAAKLAEHVADLEGEITRLTAAHDQAEAVAVAASADPVAYAKAAEAADRIKGEITTQTARLDRLKRARSEAAEREQQDYVQRLTASLTDARSNLQSVVCEVAEAERREAERHVKALAEIAARKAAAEIAVNRADSRLSDAKAGLTEADAARLDELGVGIAKVREAYGYDTLQGQYREAHAVFLSAEHRFKEAEGLALQGHGKGRMEQARGERDAAKAEAERLDARVKEMNGKIRLLTDEVQAIRGKIAKQ